MFNQVIGVLLTPLRAARNRPVFKENNAHTDIQHSKTYRLCAIANKIKGLLIGIYEGFM